MLHVFFVHSHVTILIAKMVIDYLQIPLENIVFVTDRNVTVEKEYKQFRWRYKFYPESFPSHLSIIRSIAKLYKFDKEVRYIVGGQSFHLYLPQSNIRYFQLFLSHYKCKGFSYIEEGLGSYMTKEMIQTHVSKYPQISLLDRICYLNRISDYSIFRSNYKNIYCISSNAFPDFPRKIILSGLGLKKSNKYLVFKNANILVFDAVSQFGLTTFMHHFDAIEALLTHLIKKKVYQVFFKLHPAQENTDEGFVIREKLSKQKLITFEEIDKNVSLEEVALNNPSANFYVNISSLGHYAVLFGAKVLSYANLIASSDPNYLNVIKSLPTFYTNEIDFIDYK